MRTPRHDWSAAEVAILCEAYPKGGTRAVLARLPHLSIGSIRRKVELLRLRMPERARYRKQPSSEWIDAAIRREYKTGRPKLKVLARTLGREHGWVKIRAAMLGLCRSKHGRWTEAEDALLERCLDRSMAVSTIHKQFGAAGFQRSMSAIMSHIASRGLSFHRDFWTAQDVALALATDIHSVLDWIDAGKLAAARGPGPSAIREPVDSRRLLWQIKPQAVRRFMLAHPECWDHRKMRREVLLDLLAGGDSGLNGGCWGVAN